MFNDASKPTPGTQAPDAKSILVVCPSENTLGALASLLNQAGEIALTSQDPLDAWECIKAGAIKCVVQDFTVPGPDAMVLFRAARSSKQTHGIPFLFLINKLNTPVRLGVFGADVAADDFLVLPCSSQQFLFSLGDLLNRQRMLAISVLAESLPILNENREHKDGVERQAPSIPTSVEDLLGLSSGIFAGRLGLLDVAKIVSMLEPLRLTGILKLSDGKRTGSVHFIEGAVRHAEINEIEGPDALFLLFHLKTGAFRFEVEPPTYKRTIEGTTMALLLDGLRKMDETKELVQEFMKRKSGMIPKVG